MTASFVITSRRALASSTRVAVQTSLVHLRSWGLSAPRTFVPSTVREQSSLWSTWIGATMGCWFVMPAKALGWA